MRGWERLLIAPGLLAAACANVGCFWHHGPTVDGAATLSSGTADPCRGSLFDADNADARCLHHSVGEKLPAPPGLRVALVKGPVARSGYDAGLVLEMTNSSRDPLPVELEDACGTFEGQASNQSTSSFESDCFGGCEGGPEPHVLRVTLEPGGVVRKKVRFYAVLTRIQMDSHDECVTKTIGALPPGDYDLQVTLPWIDPVPEDPTVTRPRVLTAQLTVTP